MLKEHDLFAFGSIIGAYLADIDLSTMDPKKFYDHFREWWVVTQNWNFDDFNPTEAVDFNTLITEALKALDGFCTEYPEASLVLQVGLAKKYAENH